MHVLLAACQGGFAAEQPAARVSSSNLRVAQAGVGVGVLVKWGGRSRILAIFLASSGWGVTITGIELAASLKTSIVRSWH